jgi:hypothetical protein
MRFKHIIFPRKLLVTESIYGIQITVLTASECCASPVEIGELLRNASECLFSGQLQQRRAPSHSHPDWTDIAQKQHLCTDK